MTSDAKTPDEYISQLPEDRKGPMSELRSTIRSHLPEGFEETMSYGMIGYVVPHKIYPDGYHCSPELPLPFMNIASQKNFVALYHMGVYANKDLLNWFTGEYPKHSSRKLDMGKSCIRFKKMDDIPMDLIGQLCEKMTVQDWIELYEKNIKKMS
ncbi:DUF1801 domain-containing protein [Muriicola marianensis]|uniref:YdhG-like domain-containing protein n=1 Tax=Muriicola marianensis TaxID=1324801 RepID=A0ABQ1QWS3_9FLAO|nr:DUF1801 domain-containing protein [Muriicola marianensis]GGD47763.1 hypothetical protein GCM10011361_13170 [Muriicola marianensis]